MIRIDPILITLGLMLASAALVVVVLWFGLAVLLSFGTYIETVVP